MTQQLSSRRKTISRLSLMAALVAVTTLPIAPLAGQQPAAAPGAAVTSFYDFKTMTLEGKPADLGHVQGQGEPRRERGEQVRLHPAVRRPREAAEEKRAARTSTCSGFPSNDFGGQEPGTAEEIVTFCKLTYGVTFPMFEKVVTKAGAAQSPIYSFLGTSGNLPAWNFSKYVIGKDGKIVAFFPSKVTPDAPELRAAIDKALASK